MIGRNHVLMAGAVAAMMDLHPAEIFYCAAFAHLPDHLEKIGPIRIVGHRGITHELLLWLVPLLTFRFFPSLLDSLQQAFAIGVDPQLQQFLDIRLWVLFLPGVLHLLGDVLTPRGIRVAGRKVALGLFTTGTFMEYVVTGCLVALAVAGRLG